MNDPRASIHPKSPQLVEDNTRDSTEHFFSGERYPSELASVKRSYSIGSAGPDSALMGVQGEDAPEVHSIPQVVRMNSIGFEQHDAASRVPQPYAAR
jgi:hypothetical protein